MRESWLRTLDQCSSIDIDAKFIIGDSNQQQHENVLKREAAQFSDIVRLDGVVEEYKLLSKKTAALFRYATTTTMNDVDLVMKTDDDVYLNVARLCDDLARLDLQQNNYYGFFHKYIVA